MDQRIYYVLHIVGVMVLTAYTFRAFAAPTPETRRSNLMATGIASAVVFVAGFGLLAKLKLAIAGWVIVKLVCWLFFSALAGIAHRKGQAGPLAPLALVLLAVAALCAYYKPF
jgi:hypothetical protein